MPVAPPLRPPRVRAGQSGFTLVELLIALTLLGLISVMLLGGFRFGARSWDAVVGASAERERIAATQTFLRDRLTEASVPGAAQPAVEPETVLGLIGGRDRMTFTAPWLSALSLGGLYTFILWMDEAEPGRLMLAWRPARTGADTSGDFADLASERVLLDGVSDLAITYFGAAEEGSEPAWTEAWEREDAAPGLVRITVAFADPGRQWPPLVIRPRG